MLLTVENLVIGYGRIQVINGVSLTVAPGTVVGLLGPNGAGKTTLLRAIAGFMRPWSGRICADGKDMVRDSVPRRARDGMCLIPEGRAIFSGLTVKENIAVHAQTRKADEAVDVACQIFPVLGQRLKQRAGTLSGGEQQMLAMSRAIVKRAPMVIADELSLGLAPLIVDTVFAALGKMRELGSSLLVVEQYPEKLMALADNIYFMDRGKIVREGTPSELSSTKAG